MHFLFPWMLLGSLGIAVPIAIHLLNRYRYKVVDWGAMELLRKALITRSKRIKIEDWLLLVLRCLIVMLLALALSRPVLTPEGAPWLGKGNDIGMVIAVDASFSMSHKPGAKSRFDRAAARTREIFKTLTPGNPVTLVLLGDRPRVLLRNTGFDADRFEKVLKDATPLPEGLNLEASLDEIDTLAQELRTPVKECYLVSDMQTSSWAPLSEKSRHALKKLADGGRVFCMPVASESAENLSITRLELKSGLLRVNGSARYDIDVANHGTQRRDNITVRLLVNDMPIDEGTINKLDAGKSTTISLYARFSQVGAARLTAKLDADELLLDNTRHAVAEIRDKTRVLYVTAPAEGGGATADYLLTAMGSLPQGGLDVDKVGWLDLGTRKLANYHTVILNNVPDLPDEHIRTLHYFIREGGGLIVFLGDNSQPLLVNARFQYEKAPLLPAELTELTADAKGRPIEPADHPVSRVISGLPAEFVGEAKVYRHFPLKLAPGARAILKVANQPVIAEHALGRGKIVLFAAAAESRWTNMVVEPFYPILLHEALSFVSRQAHETPTLVSHSLLFPLPVKEGSDVRKVTFQPQGGKSTAVAAVVREGQVIAELPNAEQPGFFEVRTEPETTPLFAAVNVDPRESRVQSLKPEGFGELFGASPVRIVSEGDSIESSVRESRIGREFWREMLYLALALLVVEGLLARWFSHRKAAEA